MTDSTDNARGLTVSEAFKKWTAEHPANWKMGTMKVDGKFSHFMDHDTDTAWMAFSAAWSARADLAPDPLADPRVMALVEALRGIEALAATNYTPARIARTALAALSPTGGNADAR